MRTWVSDRRWKLLGWGLFLAILLNLLVGAWWVHDRVTEFDPLGPYPVQAIDLPLVATTIDGGMYPALVVKGGVWTDVPVTGEKCVEETVQVEGTYVWQAMIPPGTVIDGQGGTGRAIRVQGCTKFAYRNRVPDGVRQRVEELARQGITSSVWSMQGKEVPFRPGTNDPGSPEFWSTRNFAIIWES